MEAETLLSHCNTCGGERRQLVLLTNIVRRDVDEHEGGWTVYETTSYKTLQCGGCETVTLMEKYDFSEYDATERKYHPPHVFRRLPDWIGALTPWFERSERAEYIQSLLRQIYSALSVEAFALAAMGVRALLEYVMVAAVTDHGTFEKNLDAFAAQGFVSKKERDRVEKILDVGSAAIHRGYLPKRADLKTLLDIAEHIIASQYVHDDAVADVSKKVPARPSRKPKVEGPLDEGSAA